MSQKTYSRPHCPGCGSSDVMTFGVALRPDADLSFAFCTHCEWKGWGHEGRKVSLDSVLNLVSR